MSTPTYGTTLRNARDAAGIRQMDLAESLGMHRALLSDVELGKRRAFHVSRSKRLAEKINASAEAQASPAATVDPIRLMALAAGERGVDAFMTAGVSLEGLEVLIVLVEKLADLTPDKAAKLRKYISRL